MNSTFSTQIEKSLDRQEVISYLHNKYPSCDINILKEIEKTIFEYIVNNTLLPNRTNISINTYIDIFIKKYNYYIIEIYNTLPKVISDIKNKKIDITDIILKPIKVYPTNWEFVLKRKEQEDKFLTKELISNSSIAVCYKCRKKNVFVQSIQTRGSDEPATIFYKCLTCGNKWRT